MRKNSSQRGFALLIMLVIVVLGSLYAVTGQLEFASRKFAREDATSRALFQAKEALIGYAATYRDVPAHSTEVFGYLPCPDTAGKTGIQTPGDGEAANNCDTAGQASVGLLPYKTLGLPDLRDSDGVCLWYAVSGSFKNSPKGTTAATPVPLNWDTHGQFEIVGSSVIPDQGDGGAVAVIFATGLPLANQSRTASGSFPCQIDPAQVAAYLDGNYDFASSATIQITPGASGSTTNNDQVAWITPKEIFERVVKRQDFSNALSASTVGQINKLSDEIRAILEQQIQTDLLAGGTPSTSLPANWASYTQNNGKKVGDAGTVTPLLTPAYDNYVTNWTNQYRQVVCSPLTTPCLSLNGVSCRGALMFGGRTAQDQIIDNCDPNTTPLATSKAGQPRPSACKTASTANLNYYFEANSGREILNSASMSFLGNSAYASASPSADVATCLFAGSYLSFAQDINSFASGLVTVFGGSTAVAAVDTVAKTVTLGNTTTNARAGCVWFPTAIEFGSTFRAYYRYMVTDTGSGRRGTGYTLALADAGTNNPASVSPILCGAADRDLIGYAGSPPSGTATRLASTSYISAATWANPNATITTLTNHGFVTGNSVTISNVSPSGYNGTFVITRISNTQFRYALASNPGASVAGIKPPKIGVEFDTRRNTAFLDPGSAADNSHFAFVYWGGSTDSNSSGGGADDNTHYAGILGSGAEPLNPRETGSTPPTATPVALLSAASWAGGTVTATSLGPHGFTTSNYVDVSDITATTYEGTYAVTATDATHFTYALAANPGSYVQGTTAIRTVTASSASWLGGVVTMNTSVAHGLAVGDHVSVTGVNPVGYNGIYLVASTPNATRITYAQASNPGGYTSGGAVTRTHSITAASWSGGTASITTSAAHGLVTGQYVHIDNISPSGYDGTYAVTVVDSTHFTYALSSDPGGAYSGSSPAGLATCSGAEITCASSAVPFSTWIHVRIDIARGYDTTTRQSTYKLRTYITDSFANCTLTDYSNLARELSSLCAQSATIGQDGVVISDISTPVNVTAAAWSSATQLVTVTTSSAHGFLSGQSVNLSGVTPSAYNGSYKVSALNATQFTFPLATDPTAYSSGGTVASQALSAVYIGFTTGRGTSSNDNQNVVISNLQLRSE